VAASTLKAAILTNMNKFDITAVLLFITVAFLLIRWIRLDNMVIVIPQPYHRRLAGYDQENDDPVYQDDLAAYQLVPRDLHRLASRLARTVRTNVYIRKRSRANDIVIMETIRQEARRINLRRRDLEAVMPLALQLSYLQTYMEHQARVMTTTSEYRTREYYTNHRYTTPIHNMAHQTNLSPLITLLTWLGLMDSFEPLTDQA
jgi:hypothetical protein